MNFKKKLGAATLAAGLVLGLTQFANASSQVTITLWDTGLLGKTLADGTPDLANSFLDQAAADFHRLNPNITVNIVQQGGDISSNDAQFQAASIAGNGPDMRVQYPGGPTLSHADVFMDLSNVFDKATYSSMSGWNTVRQDYDAKKPLLAMPYGAGLYFTVFQNNAMLKAAGIDPKKVPATWEEMIANGKAVKAKTGKNGFWAADLEGYVGAWVVGGLLGGELGPNYATEMYLNRAPVNSPEMVKVYKAWHDLYASGLTNPDAGSVSNGDSTAGFVQGKGAYYIVGSWENGNMEQNFGKAGTKVSTFFLPMLAGAKYPNTAAGGPQEAISITKYSKHKAEAIKFIKYLSRASVQDRYVKLTQVEPSNNNGANPGLIKNTFLKSQAQQLKSKTDIAYPFDNVMPQSVIDLFYKLNAAVFIGTVTPKEAADQLQAQNQQEIKNR